MMKTITIMPDFGGAPYAWIKDASDTSEYVGLMAASAEYGFDEFDVPKDLETAFSDWSLRFTRNCDDDDFDWPAFHAEGIGLAKKLKQAVGDKANVVYAKAFEDPSVFRGRSRTIAI
jgi:hypothetical protein